MKVALVTPSITFGGGVETPVVSLFVEQMSTEIDLHVFAIHYPSGTGSVRQDDFTLHFADRASDRFAYRLAGTLEHIRREHARKPFDLLHALWLHEPGTIAVATGAMLGIPVIASVGGAEVVAIPDIEYGALRLSRGRFMTAGVLLRATMITAGSTYAVRRAQNIVPHRNASRFRRAPLPVDANRFSPANRRGINNTSPRLLHAASLIPVKDQETLLLAFKRVVNSIPGAQLTIAGEDSLGRRRLLERLCDELGLGESVNFVGPLPHAEMATLYRESDLFLLSSRHESQGMVVLEAAASGVPTVGTNVGVVPDLAPDASVAVRPQDPVALGDAVIDLLHDPARLERIGRNAVARVHHEFVAPVVRDHFLSLYLETIRNQRR